MVGASLAIRQLKARLPAVARAQRTTLISGPTGAGKDVVARSLHAQSPRRERPFVTVHCAALPDTLVEAEMFGHARGAFTGATQSRAGLIRSAAGGTIFLDEIDSLPGGAQAKLLRFLETGEYRAVGSDRVEHSDAWVIAATNQNLVERVERGLFRPDLMYRLAVVNLPVPPLAERTDDILALAEHFLAQATAGAKRLADDARAAMLAYTWPGNVRELKHRVETAALFDDAGVIGREALGFAGPPVAVAPPSAAPPPTTTSLEADLWSLIADHGLTLAQAMGHVESLMIRAALRAESDNRTRAASRLGIHVRTIFKKLP
ncbi:MAG: sigma-54-dependent Fis family transcriptional regulator [Deltaproteobacteria bacterium]|nr:sigma-54-dependent Fis family transcriptional regulator [Deltaproteobacteria bacterium]